MTASVEKLLNEHIGLDVATVGHSTIERANKKRMRSGNVPDLKAYAAKLQDSNEELVALIDEVVVPETWFFRDGVPFEAFADFVKKLWVVSKKERPLRILSMPCSTGEEAYSIAIVLHEAGLARDAVCIDAVDISQRSLESARRAIYGRHSFRGTSPAFRDRYFKSQDGFYALKEPIKGMVRFHCANLLDPHTLPSREAYNVIFCRNLLIYFNRQTQQHAASILIDLLAENGLLFVGHAEAGQFLDTGLTPLPRRGSFAYQKSALDDYGPANRRVTNKSGTPRKRPMPQQRQKAVIKTYNAKPDTSWAGVRPATAA
ncbi:MAG: protein-glutamate O-methyltransferase CheR, partial [Gammaproteobacteria bacterium]